MLLDVSMKHALLNKMPAIIVYSFAELAHAVSYSLAYMSDEHGLCTYRRRVNYGSHLYKVIKEDAVEQSLISILQSMHCLA